MGNCTFGQTTTQRYGASQQDCQRAQRKERETQGAGEVDLKG